MKKLLLFLFTKAFNGKHRDFLKPCVTEMYRQIARENLELKSEIIKVKKGKRKYHLLFFETKHGKLRFNLGRHWEDKVLTSEIELN